MPALRVHSRWVLICCTLLASACDSDEFDCNDGSCISGDEICVKASDSGCTTCIPVPESCRSNATCDCVEGADLSHEPTGCSGAVACEEDDGGLVVTCSSNGWGCG